VAKLKKSVQKMEAHLAKARTALENHKKIESGINSLATLQHGLAKKELLASVKRQEDAIKELQQHISKGEEVLSLKQTELKALETPSVTTSDSSIKSAVKKPKDVAEAAKQEAVADFKKATAEVEEKVEKL
jgi:hypothetical protein